MIIRRAGAVFIADRAWITATYGVSAMTIRRRWTPTAYDPLTGAALYVVDEDQLREVRTRWRRVTLRRGDLTDDP